MPSPFPGMNPYLEQHGVWRDFHDTFLPMVRKALSPQVSPHFIVRIEEDIYVTEAGEESPTLSGRADVAIAQSAKKKQSSERSVALLEPPEKIQLAAIVETERNIYLEIRDRHDRDLVAVIELLSPSNKRFGKDRSSYLVKRERLLASDVHFIEIDLLREGPRMDYGFEPDCDYCVLVCRADEWPEAGFWRIALRDPLPVIPIPLRPPLAEVRLDLQAILHATYDDAFYKDSIYEAEPSLPLSPADAAWARKVAGLPAQET